MTYYFDYAATSPIDPLVADEMEYWLRKNCCNASSLYDGGKEAKNAIEKSRASVIKLLDASDAYLIFTSGGTEADNTAIMGGAFYGKAKGRNRIVVSSIEHHAILETAEFLQNFGFELTVLPVDSYGYVTEEALQAAMGSDVCLVSVMWVNNELGTIQDISRLAQIAHDSGALFHTDAVQAISSQNVSFNKCGADMMSVSAHKIYGPKGCGALAIRKGLEIDSFMHGGQQESGKRGGTENVACIAGFGKAAELLFERRSNACIEMKKHRQYMIDQLSAAGARINSPIDGAPTVLNVAFKNVEGEGMLFFLNRDGFCLSMGSACNSKSVEPSHVIRAIKLSDDYARGCIRISFGSNQTDDECKLLAGKIIDIAKRLTVE